MAEKRLAGHGGREIGDSADYGGGLCEGSMTLRKVGRRGSGSHAEDGNGDFARLHFSASSAWEIALRQQQNGISPPRFYNRLTKPAVGFMTAPASCPGPSPP